MASVHKVVAYVTHRRGDVVRLLVFEHPLAGVQLPAGTVEPDESPDQAALREVAEETGVTTCQIHTKLSSMQERPFGGRLVVTQDCSGHHRPDPASAFDPIRRGLYASVLERSGGFVRIEVAGVTDQRVSQTWIADRFLSETVWRHHFHLSAHWDGPDQWTQDADGHRFRPMWVPLAPHVGLVAGQAQWLTEHSPALRRHLA